MAKPIKLTEALISKMIGEFTDALRAMNMADGKVSYSKSFVWKDDRDRVSVLFTPEAYAKMLKLLYAFNTEVAWHGTVQRTAKDTFVITDILVYPQIVTGVTVDTDQEAYQQWLMALPDDTFNALHLQAHSHVDMPTHPSATDLQHQESILKQLRGEDYYIFLIINKKLEYTLKVYDLSTNTLYENADATLGILSGNGDLEGFLNEAKALVAEPPKAPARPKSKSRTYRPLDPFDESFMENYYYNR